MFLAYTIRFRKTKCHGNTNVFWRRITYKSNVIPSIRWQQTSRKTIISRRVVKCFQRTVATFVSTGTRTTRIHGFRGVIAIPHSRLTPFRQRRVNGNNNNNNNMIYLAQIVIHFKIYWQTAPGRTYYTRILCGEHFKRTGNMPVGVILCFVACAPIYIYINTYIRI